MGNIPDFLPISAREDSNQYELGCVHQKNPPGMLLRGIVFYKKMTSRYPRSSKIWLILLHQDEDRLDIDLVEARVL